MLVGAADDSDRPEGAKSCGRKFSYPKSAGGRPGAHSMMWRIVVRTARGACCANYCSPFVPGGWTAAGWASRSRSPFSSVFSGIGLKKGHRFMSGIIYDPLSRKYSFTDQQRSLIELSMTVTLLSQI